MGQEFLFGCLEGGIQTIDPETTQYYTFSYTFAVLPQLVCLPRVDLCYGCREIRRGWHATDRVKCLEPTTNVMVRGTEKARQGLIHCWLHVFTEVSCDVDRPTPSRHTHMIKK